MSPAGKHNFCLRCSRRFSVVHMTGSSPPLIRRVSTRGIHLAVLVEPYLSLILDGKKTIESRFSINRHAPFEQVQRGDVLILKRSSGPIEGLCTVSDAWFYR